MKLLVFAGVIGSALGYTFGRFLQMLPFPWSALLGFVLAVGIWLWAFRTLHELKKKQQVLDDMLKQLDQMRDATREEVARVIRQYENQ